MKETQLLIRVESDLKRRFLEKSQAEFGSGTRCLTKFIEAYSKDSFYISDDAVNLLLVAVQGLHSYCNNLNQVTKKLHSTGTLDARFTPEFIEQINLEVGNVIGAFKSVVDIDTDRIASLIEVYGLN